MAKWPRWLARLLTNYLSVCTSHNAGRDLRVYRVLAYLYDDWAEGRMEIAYLSRYTAT